jgi:GntR family transcriptional regulator / MocR family aminotransferase
MHHIKYVYRREKMLDLFSVQDGGQKVPLYMQVYRKIKEDILCGNILPGSKLTSMRNLSQDLKLSKHTVETAYDQLIADGYIKSVNRSGLYVESMGNWNNKMGNSNMEAEKDADANMVKEGMKHETPIKYDFDNALVDIDSFPYSQYKKVIGGCVDKYFSELLLSGDPQGDWGLRYEISKYIFSLRGVVCSPEQIIISSGTQHALTLLCQILSNIHKTIAIEEPSYLDIKSVFDDFNFDIVPIPLETDGINVRRIKLFDVKMVFVTPSHQFPYGMTMPIEKRLDLIKWANENNGLIIEDDYECEFKNNCVAVKAIQGLDNSGKVIYLGSFSKVLMPSIRISYMVLPENLLAI